jgi:hypothetical protein
MIAHNPLHGSGQAALPHPALALGEDAHAAQGVGMTDGRRGQPASDEAPHAIPKHAAFVAAPRQRAMPEAPDLEPKENQRRLVHGHSVVADVSTHHRLQPLPHFRNGSVPAALKFGFHGVQLRLQPFAYRLPQHRVHSVASLLHADMRKAEKVECLRLPFSTPLPVLVCERSKFQKSRFLGMQFQVELPRCPGRVLLGQVPFGQTTSLHPLRRRLPDIVRGLRRYNRSVRLPGSVRHRRTSLDFPTRPKATADLGSPGSRARCLRTCTGSLTARDSGTSRFRWTRWSFPLLLTPSAPRRKLLTRLNTRPARSPVNASTLPSRAAPHDSGPRWVPDPLSYDFCIHYTSPV